MENNICNNGSLKRGEGRDECPTSSRLCLLTRIDAHVEAETHSRRTRFYIFGENSQLPIYCESIQAAGVLSYWQFRNNFLQETQTPKCQEPIKWLNEQSNVGIKKMNYLFIGILKSKGGITFLLFLLPLCSQPIYTLPTPLPPKLNKTDDFLLLPKLPCSDMLCILWMFI